LDVVVISGVQKFIDSFNFFVELVFAKAGAAEALQAWQVPLNFLDERHF